MCVTADDVAGGFDEVGSWLRYILPSGDQAFKEKRPGFGKMGPGGLSQAVFSGSAGTRLGEFRLVSGVGGVGSQHRLSNRQRSVGIAGHW